MQNMQRIGSIQQEQMLFSKKNKESNLKIWKLIKMKKHAKYLAILSFCSRDVRDLSILIE